MIPAEWLDENREEILKTASEPELSGGNIINVIRRCAIALCTSGNRQLTDGILHQALIKEKEFISMSRTF